MGGDAIIGGVVPVLEAEIAGLRADLDNERGYTESARADVNALRCRNREAAGRIDRLEAELDRLRTERAVLDDGTTKALRLFAARNDYLRSELVKRVAVERGIAAGTREHSLLRAEITHDASRAAEGETEAERDARHLAERERVRAAHEAAEREHDEMEAAYQRSLLADAPPDTARG